MWVVSKLMFATCMILLCVQQFECSKDSDRDAMAVKDLMDGYSYVIHCKSSYVGHTFFTLNYFKYRSIMAENIFSYFIQLFTYVSAQFFPSQMEFVFIC